MGSGFDSLPKSSFFDFVLPTSHTREERERERENRGTDKIFPTFLFQLGTFLSVTEGGVVFYIKEVYSLLMSNPQSHNYFIYLYNIYFMILMMYFVLLIWIFLINLHLKFLIFFQDFIPARSFKMFGPSFHADFDCLNLKSIHQH